MNPSILVFTRDQNLLCELGHHFEGQHPIVACETLDSLPDRLKAQPVNAVSSVAYLGIGTSSWVDLALVAGEVAVIAALAISVLVKIGPAHYSVGRAPRTLSMPHW